MPELTEFLIKVSIANVQISKILVRGFKSYSYPTNFRLKSRLQIINDHSFLAQMAVFLEYFQAEIN